MYTLKKNIHGKVLLFINIIYSAVNYIIWVILRVGTFFSVQYTKTGNNVANEPQNIPNDRRMYQMTITYQYQISVQYIRIPDDHKIYQHFPLHRPQKITQICIFSK
jgi:hypothetical protein